MEDNRKWSLVCETRLGKVSILRDLSTPEARETYKRLKPDTRPEKHIWPEDRNSAIGTWSMGRSYGPTDDWLDKVHIISHDGSELEPWHGVEPKIIDHRPSEWELKEQERREAKDLANKEIATQAKVQAGIPENMPAMICESSSRCSECSRMSKQGDAMIWIADGCRKGDSVESIVERSTALNRHSSAWCIPCAKQALNTTTVANKFWSFMR